MGARHRWVQPPLLRKAAAAGGRVQHWESPAVTKCSATYRTTQNNAPISSVSWEAQQGCTREQSGSIPHLQDTVSGHPHPLPAQSRCRVAQRSEQLHQERPKTDSSTHAGAERRESFTYPLVAEGCHSIQKTTPAAEPCYTSISSQYHQIQRGPRQAKSEKSAAPPAGAEKRQAATGAVCPMHPLVAAGH